jgi:hypothetical protein
MNLPNRVVGAVLRSPAGGLLSRSTDLVRYTGRRSGRVVTTPTQYVRDGDDVIILVGRSSTKRWWRNFVGGADMELYLERAWQPMRGEAVRGSVDPGTLGPLLERYLARFPKAARQLEGDDRDERIRRAVVVHCTPRGTS